MIKNKQFKKKNFDTFDIFENSKEPIKKLCPKLRAMRQIY
jgi:hypothetical protein